MVSLFADLSVVALAETEALAETDEGVREWVRGWVREWVSGWACPWKHN